jgi:hypothetical protein
MREKHPIPMSHNETLRTLRDFTGVEVNGKKFKACMRELEEMGVVVGNISTNRIQYTLTGKLLPEEEELQKEKKLKVSQGSVDAYTYAYISRLMCPLVKALKKYSETCATNKERADKEFNDFLTNQHMKKLLSLRHAVEPPYRLTDSHYKNLCERYEKDLASAPLIGFDVMEIDESAKEEDYEGEE